MNATAAAILNAIKTLANIDDELHLNISSYIRANCKFKNKNIRK